MRKLALVFLMAIATPVNAASTQDFSSAYRAILDRSLRIETQKLEIEASEQRRLRQWGSLAPSVSFDVSEAQKRVEADQTIQTGPVRGAAVTGSVNIFRSGADIAGIGAAKSNLESNREKLLSERQAVEEEAIGSLVTFVARVRAREITEKIVQIRAESLRIAKERFQKGLLPMQEVDKVAIDLDNSRAKLIDAETKEADSRATLKAALGHDAIVIDWPWREALVKTQELETAEFSLEKRPDWRSLKATSEEQRQLRRQALGNLLPSLDFLAKFGNEDLSQPGRRDYSLLLTFSVPLFNGFKDYSAYRIQGLEARVADFRLEALRRRAPAEIESLRRSHRAARDSALAREKTAKVSEKLFADNQQRFRMGRATVNELAFDQDRLFQSQLLEVEGWLTLHLTFTRLCHGLGGFVSASGTGVQCRPEAP